MDLSIEYSCSVQIDHFRLGSALVYNIIEVFCGTKHFGHQPTLSLSLTLAFTFLLDASNGVKKPYHIPLISTDVITTFFFLWYAFS